MFRFVFPLVAMLASVVFLSNTAMAQPAKVTPLSTGIKLGEKFEGEFGAKHKGQAWVSKPDTGMGVIGPDPNLYIGTIPITLKAGQGMSITATVTGQDRLVGIHVLDSAGKRIMNPEERKLPRPQGADPTHLSEKTVEHTIGEVSVTGKYTIVIISDRVGPFTLKATSDSGDDRESLEKRLKELKKEVAEIEAKLKAADEKPKKK